MKILISGSLGLIGSEAVKFCQGNDIIGIDNQSRNKWFGCERGVVPVQKGYSHSFADIRKYHQLEELFKKHKFDYIIHTAGQPSHDFAAQIPIEDFEVNAGGTLNLLELTRQYCPGAVFIFTSTNKVYGDLDIPLRVVDKRYVPYWPEMWGGFNETTPIDQTTHSLFGVSKTAADLYVQEYGRYFNMNTVSFRGGCLTGSSHAGTQLHGFLNYLVRCAKYDIPYKIFGTGLQIRDNIHAYDLITAFEEFRKNPRPGAVYNIGGGTHSNCSILEAIDIISEILGTPYTNYTIEENNWRKGDHKYYISDVSKFRTDYPEWNYTYDIRAIIKEIFDNV